MSSRVSRVIRDARLGEQEHQQARGPGAGRAGVVGERAADQGEALLLADWLGEQPGGLMGRQCQARQETVVHREEEETPGHHGGGAAGGSMPAVQAGLGQC